MFSLHCQKYPMNNLLTGFKAIWVHVLLLPWHGAICLFYTTLDSNFSECWLFAGFGDIKKSVSFYWKQLKPHLNQILPKCGLDHFTFCYHSGSLKLPLGWFKPSMLAGCGLWVFVNCDVMWNYLLYMSELCCEQHFCKLILPWIQGRLCWSLFVFFL